MLGRGVVIMVLLLKNEGEEVWGGHTQEAGGCEQEAEGGGTAGRERCWWWGKSCRCQIYNNYNLGHLMFVNVLSHSGWRTPLYCHHTRQSATRGPPEMRCQVHITRSTTCACTTVRQGILFWVVSVRPKDRACQFGYWDSRVLLEKHPHHKISFGLSVSVCVGDCFCPSQALVDSGAQDRPARLEVDGTTGMLTWTPVHSNHGDGILVTIFFIFPA